MRLTDLENGAESGIDMVATPPGKKLQSVLLLSGGEKALTALALLVRKFQYTAQPVLYSRRSRCSAGRSRHRPLHGTCARNEPRNAVHPDHAQQEDDEHRARALRRHHAGAGGSRSWCRLGLGRHNRAREDTARNGGCGVFKGGLGGRKGELSVFVAIEGDSTPLRSSCNTAR